MSNLFRLRQTWDIARLQLRRVFFSRRSLGVYFLALFPSLMFFGHGIMMKINYSSMSSKITPAALLESISQGTSEEEVIKKTGKPNKDRRFNIGPNKQSRRHMMYFDGERRWNLFFSNGVLQNKHSQQIFNLNGDRMAFASMFQTYYLRLAIFFGCLVIFMNLFRGEMTDKTLHFWFLAPARREVLLAGKYLAGTITTVTIFAVGAVLSYAIMLWPHHSAQVTAFWQDQGLLHLFSYTSSAALACIGYGSVFLAVGLVLRNPIVTAVVILLWEYVNGILPSLLQKLSVLYYAQSLCPVSVPVDKNMPLLIRLLMSPAEPPSVFTAVFGFIIVTALVLWIASFIIRRLEINYNTE